MVGEEKEIARGAGFYLSDVSSYRKATLGSLNMGYWGSYLFKLSRFMDSECKNIRGGEKVSALRRECAYSLKLSGLFMPDIPGVDASLYTRVADFMIKRRDLELLYDVYQYNDGKPFKDEYEAVGVWLRCADIIRGSTGVYRDDDSLYLPTPADLKHVVRWCNCQQVSAYERAVVMWYYIIIEMNRFIGYQMFALVWVRRLLCEACSEFENISVAEGVGDPEYRYFVACKCDKRDNGAHVIIKFVRYVCCRIFWVLYKNLMIEGSSSIYGVLRKLSDNRVHTLEELVEWQEEPCTVLLEDVASLKSLDVVVFENGGCCLNTEEALEELKRWKKA